MMTMRELGERRNSSSEVDGGCGKHRKVEVVSDEDSCGHGR